MIYTVTLNPALDYVVRLDKLEINHIHRANSEDIFAGGKGINISNVLANLDIENTALGFIAGFTGDEIERQVANFGVIPRFIKLESGLSRINIKLRDGNETDINAQGANIMQSDIDKLFELLEIVQEDDYVALAGSIPASLDTDIYEKIIQTFNDKRVNVIVDATGRLLTNTIKYKPFLIKPNNDELSAIFGRHISDEAEIIEYAKILHDKGARNVLVSRGSKGSILLCENGDILKMDGVENEVVNTVGAGDSMVAGFIAGWIEHHDYQKALKLGTAAGIATALSVGIASREKILDIYKKL